MSETITSEQVVSAAKELGKPEFTRADLAEKLQVERSDIKDGFKVARKSGTFEKTRNDGEGTGHFKLTEQ